MKSIKLDIMPGNCHVNFLGCIAVTSYVGYVNTRSKELGEPTPLTTKLNYHNNSTQERRYLMSY